METDLANHVRRPAKARRQSSGEKAQVQRAQGGRAPIQSGETEAGWHVHQAGVRCHHGEVQNLPKHRGDLSLRKAGTHQRFPNEDGSRWPYFGHGIQVSMPGLQEPHAHQPDECLRG